MVVRYVYIYEGVSVHTRACKISRDGRCTSVLNDKILKIKINSKLNMMKNKKIFLVKNEE